MIARLPIVFSGHLPAATRIHTVGGRGVESLHASALILHRALRAGSIPLQTAIRSRVRSIRETYGGANVARPSSPVLSSPGGKKAVSPGCAREFGIRGRPAPAASEAKRHRSRVAYKPCAQGCFGPCSREHFGGFPAGCGIGGW